MAEVARAQAVRSLQRESTTSQALGATGAALLLVACAGQAPETGTDEDAEAQPAVSPGETRAALRWTHHLPDRWARAFRRWGEHLEQLAHACDDVPHEGVCMGDVALRCRWQLGHLLRQPVETDCGASGQICGYDERGKVSCVDVSAPNLLKVAVYVPRRVATCFIGDACEPGSPDCIGLRDDQNALVEGFSASTFRAVRTDSPERETAGKQVCVEMVLSDDELAGVDIQLEAFRRNVLEWSHGDIVLDLRRIEFEQVDINESRFGIGVWVAPWDLSALALPRLDFVPDANLVIPPIRDPQLGLHHDLGGCGGTLGADFGLAGAGFSWVPTTATSFFFECAEQPVFTHELLHQLHFAYHTVSRFEDLYTGAFPACGEGADDPHAWFPDSHQCNEDPDFERCGQNDCGSGDLVNEHLLSEHWDPAFDFVANHCKDGRQDFNETGVDSGGPCLALQMAALP